MSKDKVFKCKLTAYKHSGTEIKQDVEPKRLIKLLTELRSNKGRELCLDEVIHTDGTQICWRFGIIGGWKNHQYNDAPTHHFSLDGDEISFEDNISQRFTYKFNSVAEANEFWTKYVTNSIYKVNQ